MLLLGRRAKAGDEAMEEALIRNIGTPPTGTPTLELAKLISCLIAIAQAEMRGSTAGRGVSWSDDGPGS